MEGKSRFTPRQINKALRILRELPVKDGRKSIRETLRLLEQGMRDALDKGYSRGEIRQQIAEAEIIISATTLKGFLAEEQKDAGQNQDAAAARVPEKNGQGSNEKTAGGPKENGPRPDEKSASDSEKSGRKQHEDLAEKPSPGSIVIKPDTPREEL